MSILEETNSVVKTHEEIEENASDFPQSKQNYSQYALLTRIIRPPNLLASNQVVIKFKSPSPLIPQQQSMKARPSRSSSSFNNIRPN